MKRPVKTNTKTKAKKQGSTAIHPLLLVSALFFIALISYLGRKISLSTKQIITVNFVAFMLGLLFESLRVSNNWLAVFYIFVGSLFCSLSAFFPSKAGLVYVFDEHLARWPYFFLVIFILFYIVFHSHEVTAKLTEGITLLQSLSINYWIIDYGFWNIDSWLIRSFIIVLLLFSLFAFFNSLTRYNLSRPTRLILSIGSSVIMLLFAIDNMVSVYYHQSVVSAEIMSQTSYVGLQFFLLGASSIYIAQNLFLLLSFLPGRNSFFNSLYFDELAQLKDTHIERYSDRQVDIGYSIICIVFTVSVYWINYRHNYLSRNTMIWANFVFFPLLIALLNRLWSKFMINRV